MSGLRNQMSSANYEYTITDYDIFVPKVITLLNNNKIRDFQYYTGYRWSIINSLCNLKLNKNIKVL